MFTSPHRNADLLTLDAVFVAGHYAAVTRWVDCECAGCDPRHECDLCNNARGTLDWTEKACTDCAAAFTPEGLMEEAPTQAAPIAGQDGRCVDCADRVRGAA
jgi:hypothetical protein